jgi:hypothetical protein
MRKQNEAKREYGREKKNTEAKQSKKKNMGSEKVDAKFSLKHAKQKRNKSRFSLK